MLLACYKAYNPQHTSEAYLEAYLRNIPPTRFQAGGHLLLLSINITLVLVNIKNIEYYSIAIDYYSLTPTIANYFAINQLLHSYDYTTNTLRTTIAMVDLWSPCGLLCMGSNRHREFNQSAAPKVSLPACLHLTKMHGMFLELVSLDQRPSDNSSKHQAVLLFI